MGFWYFGYGSNLNLASMAAKGVKPLSSSRAVLHGWRLRFNVAHFFTHEGGVGNIERSQNEKDAVWGVLHFCSKDDLSLLDAAEANGYGYDRMTVTVETDDRIVEAITYTGTASFLDDRCLPTRRYLQILIDGAIESELPEEYISGLRKTPILQPIPKGRFTPPPGVYPRFTAEMLSREPNYTALAGHVFDMSSARAQHDFLRRYFAGKDMTIFHLRRMHRSAGNEEVTNWSEASLSPEQDQYINEYLHAYNKEYRYCGMMERVQ